jgi:hypothetical protein
VVLAIQQIQVKFCAEKKELRPDLGLFDPNDCLIFELQETKAVDRFELHLQIQELQVKQESFHLRSCQEIKIKQVRLEEPDNSLRFK